MIRRFQYSLAILLLLALSVRAQIKVNDPTAGIHNRAELTGMLAGKKPAKLPVGTIFIDGTVTTPMKSGCRLNADGGMSGWPVGNHPTLTGCLTRVVQVGKGPLLRLSGVGFTCDDPIEWVGDGESAIIEVEGRRQVPTGRHRFRNQTFSNAAYTFYALAGYYDGTKFIADENHADNVLVDGCEFYSVRCVWRSDNQQAIGWKFRDCLVNQLGDKFPDCVFADIRRGGCVTISDLQILHPRLTIFKVRDYSPNQCYLVCRNFYRDRMVNEDGYLTLFEYAGDEANQGLWSLDVSGWVPRHHAPWDESKLLKMPDKMRRDGWNVNLLFSGVPR